jgi:hypothetical protein
VGIDDEAVVTPDLRVKGIDNLRIADASIMQHPDQERKVGLVQEKNCAAKRNLYFSFRGLRHLLLTAIQVLRT